MDLLQITASLEGLEINEFEPRGQLDGAQGGAVYEGSRGQILHVVGEMHLGQSGTALEYALSHQPVVGNLQKGCGLQRGTTCQQPAADVIDGVGDGDLLEGGTPLKGVVTDSPQGIGPNNLTEGGAVHEGGGISRVQKSVGQDQFGELGAILQQSSLQCDYGHKTVLLGEVDVGQDQGIADLTLDPREDVSRYAAPGIVGTVVPAVLGVLEGTALYGMRALHQTAPRAVAVLIDVGQDLLAPLLLAPPAVAADQSVDGHSVAGGLPLELRLVIMTVGAGVLGDGGIGLLGGVSRLALGLVGGQEGEQGTEQVSPRTSAGSGGI